MYNNQPGQGSGAQTPPPIPNVNPVSPPPFPANPNTAQIPQPYPGYPGGGQMPPQYPGYPPMYPPYPKKKSKAWIPIVIIGGLLLIAFAVLAILGIFPGRPKMELSMYSYEFGSQVINTSGRSQTIEVTNTGHGKLKISSIDLDNTADFSVGADGCSGEILKRDDSCTFDVTFSPRSRGAKVAVVDVASNLRSSDNSVSLSGYAALTVAVYGAVDTSWTSDVQSKLESTGFFDTVDIYDATAMVPTLEVLQQYSAVFVFSDADFYDSATFGNVLADYVDAGGGVVVATFAFDDSTYEGLFGNMQNYGYLPFDHYAHYENTLLRMVKEEPNHPILNGVSSFNGGSSSYHNYVYLSPNAELVASWDDGFPLVAVTEPGTGRVVGLNFYPVSSDVRSDFWDTSTDGALLMANSLVWAANSSTGQ